MALIRIKLPIELKIEKRNGKDVEIKKYKEFVTRESIRNIKRAYVMQEDFLDLGSKIDFDGEEASTDQIKSGIHANNEVFDKVISFIADVVNNEDLSADFIEDNYSQEDLLKASQELINKLLHVDEKTDGVSNSKKPLKKSAQVKPSEA